MINALAHEVKLVDLKRPARIFVRNHLNGPSIGANHHDFSGAEPTRCLEVNSRLAISVGLIVLHPKFPMTRVQEHHISFPQADTLLFQGALQICRSDGLAWLHSLNPLIRGEVDQDAPSKEAPNILDANLRQA